MKINIGDLAGGAVTERISIELQKVLDNIADPNTDWKKPRKLTVELTFKPDEERDIAHVSVKTVPKLVHAYEVQTKLVIGTDGKGKVDAAELRSGVRNQMMILTDQNPAQIADDRGVPVPQEPAKSNVIPGTFK